VNSGSLSKDGKTLVLAGQDFWVHLVDVGTSKELDILKGHHGPVHCCRWAPDDITFASSAEDGTIRIWAPSTNKESTTSQ
jgi:serine-threonine kinase receptor-associated protein